MFKIDQYAYTNRLSAVHPAEKMMMAGLTMLICLIFGSPPVSLLVLLIMTAAIVVFAGIPGYFLGKLLAVPMLFLVVGVVTVALTVTGDSGLLFWGINIGGFAVGVTTDGLYKAGELLLRSLGAVSCLYFLALTTPMTEILSLLGKLKLPPLLIELMSITYRYIFVLLETADRIYVSQASRWGYATWKSSYFSLGQLLSNLFSKSFYSSRMLYMALSSRCYQGQLRVLDKKYCLCRRNLCLIAAIDMMLAVVGLLTR
ncbi:MAG: cobalt ECF transporter T component CbiQ [Thermoanaerobacterales bacterium]|jgi:cobalt/nickel transport system permease protein|nr:cobalt ECF transporter T component CbiQ [Thermoanaerobacterales bacterium]